MWIIDEAQNLLGVDQFVHAQLDVAPELRAPVARLEPECACQATLDVDAAEVGLGLVEDRKSVV